jgi:hypothetical protein
VIGLGGGREHTLRSGARQLGYRFLAFQGATELPLTPKLALVSGVSIERRDYRGTDPLFLRGRDDTQLDATLGVRLALTKGVSVRPRVTLTRNYSDIALNDYSRITASAGLRIEF